MDVAKQLRTIKKRLSVLKGEKKLPDLPTPFGKGLRRIGGVKHSGDGRGVRLVYQHFGEFEANNRFRPTLRTRLPKLLSPRQARIEADEHKHGLAIILRAASDRLKRIRAKRRRKGK